MNKTFNVTVKDKIAVNMTDDVLYICGNSDFVVNFGFDSEWDEFDTKTARFIKDDRTYQDVVFQGSQCQVPIISDTYKIRVGVFAGNLKTTTSAVISAKKSILCGNGSPAAPSDDVYNQIMDLIKNLGEVDPAVIEAAVKDYLAENPIDTEVSDEQIAEAVQNYLTENPVEVEIPEEKISDAVETYLTENPIEADGDFLPIPITAEVGQYFQVEEVDESGKVTKVKTVDAPSGGGGSEITWELVGEVTVTEDSPVAKIEFTNLPNYRYFTVYATKSYMATANTGISIYINGYESCMLNGADGNYQMAFLSLLDVWFGMFAESTYGRYRNRTAMMPNYRASACSDPAHTITIKNPYNAINIKSGTFAIYGGK